MLNTEQSGQPATPLFFEWCNSTALLIPGHDALHIVEELYLALRLADRSDFESACLIGSPLDVRAFSDQMLLGGQNFHRRSEAILAQRSHPTRARVTFRAA